MSANERQIAIFTSADGEASLMVQLDQDTVWLSQKQMAELLDKDSDAVACISGIFSKRGSSSRKQQPRNPRSFRKKVRDRIGAK